MIDLISIKVTPFLPRSCFTHLLTLQEELYSVPTVCFRLSILICLMSSCMSKKQVWTTVWSNSSHLRYYFGPVVFPPLIFFHSVHRWAVIWWRMPSLAFYIAVLGSHVINYRGVGIREKHLQLNVLTWSPSAPCDTWRSLDTCPWCVVLCLWKCWVSSVPASEDSCRIQSVQEFWNLKISCWKPHFPHRYFSP